MTQELVRASLGISAPHTLSASRSQACLQAQDKRRLRFKRKAVRLVGTRRRLLQKLLHF
jgi:hypothetical protein